MNTPRTDALAKREFVPDGVWIKHARELERENAALREALQSAENGLRHALMMEPLDPFKRGKIISEALDVVRAAITVARAKEAKP